MIKIETYGCCATFTQDELTVTRPLAPEEEVAQPSFLRSHISRSSIYKKAFPKNGMFIIQCTKVDTDYGLTPAVEHLYLSTMHRVLQLKHLCIYINVCVSLFHALSFHTRTHCTIYYNNDEI